MTTRRQLLTVASAMTFLVAGCTGELETEGNASGTERGASTTEAAFGKAEALSEEPDCSNPDEQAKLVVTVGGVTVPAETREAADSFVERISENADTEAEILETGDGYVVEVRRTDLSVEELRTLADRRDELGSVRPGVTTVTLQQVGASVEASLAESEDVSGFSVYRVRTDDSKPDEIVAILHVEGADGLSPSESITFYAETDGERRELVDESLFEVTGVEERNGTPFVTLELTEAGQRQFRDRLMEIADLQGRTREILYIGVGDEQVWSGSLGQGLAHEIESGEWDGRLSVSFSDEETVSAFTSAGNLLQLSVPAETELKRC